MMRGVICLLALVPFMQPARAEWMTGEHLLQRWSPVNPADISLQPGGILATKQLVAEHRTMMNREYIQGYIEALSDATKGRSWCFNGKYQTPNPETFWDESQWGLRRLPAEQLKRNAADLLVEIWRKKWPCPDQRRQK